MGARKMAKPTPLICFITLSVAAVGYFTGLQSPVTSASDTRRAPRKTPDREQPEGDAVLPATHYRDMPAVTISRRQNRAFELQSSVESLEAVKISPQDKLQALLERGRNRAFNGAPPTIPHPVDQLSAKSCMACHGEGARMISLRIPRMSHQFLTNCTQCHVERQPTHATASVFRENEFNGMEAPTSGPRAFAGAPPQIPHSTWMRADCLSCHGPSGQPGIRTTHPWRKNCQQCHAPSATMDQTLLAPKPKFLPGPKVGGEG